MSGSCPASQEESTFPRGTKNALSFDCILQDWVEDVPGVQPDAWGKPI
jgi:hypothetical protein